MKSNKDEPYKLYKTAESLSETWSKCDKSSSKLTVEDFLSGYNSLLKEINLIERDFDVVDQEPILKGIFQKYAKLDETQNSMNFQEFENLFFEYLADKLKVFYVIDVDVGGTNTHMVILKMPNLEIICKSFVSTTVDIKTGVYNCLVKLFKEQELKEEKVEIKDIATIRIGTTAFLNAVVQRSDYLNKVYVLRLCCVSTRALPPFVDFPEDLKYQIFDESFREKKEERAIFLDGSCDISGNIVEEMDETKFKEMIYIMFRYRRVWVSRT